MSRLSAVGISGIHAGDGEDVKNRIANGTVQPKESFHAPGRHRLPCPHATDQGTRQKVLGIADERLNVDGGAISIGHPFGMTGARPAGHVLLEGRRRKAKWGVVTMCIAGGMGAAGPFEIY